MGSPQPGLRHQNDTESHLVSAYSLYDSLGFAGNIGAFQIRIGSGGILYYNYNKEPPKPYSNY